MSPEAAAADPTARHLDPPSPPPAVVLIGVSGSGKTTVGALLAKRLGWIFADGDRFHSPENIAKMMALKPLTDADRSPWLAEIGGWIDREGEQNQACVVACSALKQVYRDVLRDGRPQVRLVYLVVPSERLRSRMLAREGHMFDADMLASQLAILEWPTPDEGVYQIKSMPTPAQTVDAVIRSAHLEPFVVARTAERSAAPSPATTAAPAPNTEAERGRPHGAASA